MSQREGIDTIAGKLGCSYETPRQWMRQGERDDGKRPGSITGDLEWIRTLERDIRELRQANEILRKASAWFAIAERAEIF